MSSSSEKELSTRPAKAEEFDWIWTIYSNAVKDKIGPMMEKGWVVEQEIEKFRSSWDRENSHVIELEREAIGWCCVKEDDGLIEIEQLYFEEGHRGKGYATIILSEMLKEWKQKGMKIQVPLLKNSRPLSLAKRLGFFEIEKSDELTHYWQYE